MATEPDEPFDRWHKRHPKPEKGDAPCCCGTKKKPLYPSAEHGRGQRWQARYTDPNGNRRRPAFDTWQGAMDHLDKVRVDMRAGAWVDADAGLKTVSVYANELIERRRKREKNSNTTDTYETHFRVHILPFAGQRVAKTLKRSDTMALVDELIDKPGMSDYYGPDLQDMAHPHELHDRR